MTDHTLTRGIVVRARPATVFGFLTDPARWAAWFGQGSTIEAHPGGAMRIVFPGGVEVTGEVVSAEEPAALSFSYGYASGEPVAPGSTTVTLRLTPVAEGTRVDLEHALPDPATADAHRAGWAYQLALLANLVWAAAAGDVEDIVDRWFAAWSVNDESAFAAITTPAVSYRDRFACALGRDELTAHVAAAQRQGAAGAIERRGPVHACQGTLLAHWSGSGEHGLTVFELDADGVIAAATGFSAQ